MYYNEAYCNIYNPVLILCLSVFFLELKCTKIQCVIKMQIFYLLSIMIILKAVTGRWRVHSDKTKKAFKKSGSHMDLLGKGDA